MKFLPSLVLATTALGLSAFTQSALANDTTFTYQGQLTQSGSPASGNFNFQFSLWNALSAGTQIGSTITQSSVPVSNGLFTVQLDFGTSAFDNSDRWLQISVNAATLSPRQPISRAPYAVQTRGINVDSTGNVGVGTTSPSAKLHIAGDAIFNSGLKPGNTASSMSITSTQILAPATLTLSAGANMSVASSATLTLTASIVNINGLNTLGIAGSNGGFTLGVNGSAAKTGGGSWSVISDRRLKKNIQPLQHSLDRLLQLHGVTFEYIDPSMPFFSPGVQNGMIAQDVERTFPQWVDTSDNGYKLITYRGFEALTVEALRDLRAEKGAEISKLQNENADLRARLEKLESLVQSLADHQQENHR